MRRGSCSEGERSSKKSGSSGNDARNSALNVELGEVSPDEAVGVTTIGVSLVGLDIDSRGEGAHSVVVVPHSVAILPFGKVTVELPGVVLIGGVLHKHGLVPGAGVQVVWEQSVKVDSGTEFIGFEVVVIDSEGFSTNSVDSKTVPALNILLDDRNFIAIFVDGDLAVDLLDAVLGEEKTEAILDLVHVSDGPVDQDAGSVAIGVDIVQLSLLHLQEVARPEVGIQVVLESLLVRVDQKLRGHSGEVGVGRNFHPELLIVVSGHESQRVRNLHAHIFSYKINYLNRFLLLSI